MGKRAIDKSRRRCRNGGLTLTQGIALEMFIYRTQGKTVRDVAKLYGVTSSAVSSVMNRKTAVARAAWQQLTPEKQKLFEAEHFVRQKARRGRLRPRDVADIWRRTRTESPAKAAKLYGVGRQVAYAIAYGKSWRWLTKRLPGANERPSWMRQKEEVVSGD